MLKNKNILIIIGGGISAYKSLDLIRLLKKNSYNVKTILTESGKEFVTPLSLSSLSGDKTYQKLFENSDDKIDHISLSRWSDLVIVMPATANFLSKLSHGKADDLATATILASDKDIFLVPAMNVRMWVHPATQENYKTLKGFGYNFVGPEKGEMACGEYGDGKMSSPRQILKEIQLYFKNSYFLKDKKLKALVTTGPTREYIDKVRYVSNNSSGKQGYELAKSLHRSGVDTTLVMGPTNLDPIKNLKIIKVKTANEMLNAVKSLLPVDIAICAAAVSDFKPKKTFKGKIKKNDDKIDKLELEKNPDILEFLGKNNRNRPKLVVGFAAEVENVILNAKNKLISKNCDWIVANDVSKADTGFDVDNNKVILLDKNGEKINIDKNKKNFIAAKITDKILKNFLMNKEELN
tara:strand:+ start:2048 stop:3271 length:1224 start_codon:yes stop_codon:yes gene_type:complete